MSATRKWASRTIRAAVIGVAGFGVVLASTAAPANADSNMSAELSINPYIPGIQYVYVGGLIRMSQYDAQGYINNGARVVVKLWGDDPSYDDDIAGPYPAFDMHASAEGLVYAWYGGIRNSVLNEDWGGDEIYANAIFFDVNGHYINDARTNNVSGNY